MKYLRSLFKVVTLNSDYFKKTIFINYLSNRYYYNHYLEELGEIVINKTNNKYQSGQCFINKSFAYRGIILCPWRAILFNKNNKERKPIMKLYYQVLIDERDLSFIKIQTDYDLNKLKKTNLMFSMIGLDHISSNDIIPYKSTNYQPFKHTNFNKFFNVLINKKNNYKFISIVPKLKLYEWRRKYSPWLNTTQVHLYMKDNIRITAMSFYMGKKNVLHWWLLNIKFENLSNDIVILQGQEWEISDKNNNNIDYNDDELRFETIKFRGLNLIRNETILSPRSPVIQYCNYINLLTPSGRVWSNYRIKRFNECTPFLSPTILFILNSEVVDHNLGENVDIYNARVDYSAK